MYQALQNCDFAGVYAARKLSNLRRSSCCGFGSQPSKTDHTIIDTEREMLNEMSHVLTF